MGSRTLICAGLAVCGWGLAGYIPAASQLSPPKPDQPALIIRRLGIRSVILEGDAESVLRRGVGHIPGTARPGGSGNVGLAGHRDTVFRPLEQIRRGDEIEIHAGGRRILYRVVERSVVDPSSVSVLAPQAGNTLTLVTCYPFRFVGHAPKRFIVHAREAGRLTPRESVSEATS